MAKKIVTQDSLITQLDEIRQLAMAEKQTAAAIAAVMGVPKICGLIVDKKEVSNNYDQYAAMTKEELIAFLKGKPNAVDKIH
jgi:hypothetical protein